MKQIDLHVHSCFSDGSETPSGLVELAKNANLSAFALTDHDTTSGIDEIIQAAKGSGIEIVPGIEFSTRYGKKDIHILGYFMDYHASSFQDKLKSFLEARTNRNEKMCQLIREYTGFPIYLHELERYFPNSIITRAHIATWLLEQGYINDREDAFKKYIGDHAPCFVAKTDVSPKDAIELTLEHGGVPVLAHPLLYSFSKKQLQVLLEELKTFGLRGIEAIYVLNKGSDTNFVCDLAKHYELLITGGSDFHGENKPNISLGTGIKNNLSIPYELLEQLKLAKASC